MRACAEQGQSGDPPPASVENGAHGFGTRAIVLCTTVLILIPVLVYWRTLDGFFLGEDFGFVHTVHTQWQSTPSFFIERFYRSRPHGSPYYRPVLMLSFLLDYRLWGTNPIGYHATNQLLHVLCGLLLFRLALVLGENLRLACLAGLAFALFPASTEVVVFISSRQESLALAFVLLAANLTVTSTRRPYRLGAFFASLLALGTMEWAVGMLPLMTAIRVVVNRNRGHEGTDSILRAFRETTWAWALVPGYLALRLYLFGTMGGQTFGSEYLDVLSAAYWWERVTYPFTLLAPIPTGEFGVGVSVVCGLGFLTLLGIRGGASRGSVRTVAVFALLWILCAFAPHYSVSFDTSTLENARHLYAATPGYCLLVGCAIVSISGTLGWRTWALLFLIFGFYLLATLSHQASWVRAGRMSPQLMTNIHELVENSRADKLSLVGIPAAIDGARFGAAMHIGIVRPPFRAAPPDLAFEVITDRPGERILDFASLLDDRIHPDRPVQRFTWNGDGSFSPVPEDESITLRGILENPGDGTAGVRCTKISVEPVPGGDSVTEATLVEIRGTNVGSATEPRIEAEIIRPIDPILEMGDEVRGASVRLRVRSAPRSRYWLLGPALEGFVPVGTYGTILLDQLLPTRVGTIPRDGVAEETIVIPDIDTVEDTVVHWQAIVLSPEGHVAASEPVCVTVAGTGG